MTATDNQLFVEAVIRKFRSGAPWRDFPEHFWELEKRPPLLQPLDRERRLAAYFQAFGGDEGVSVDIDQQAVHGVAHAWPTDAKNRSNDAI